MIFFTGLLALLQIYVINQFGFWGLAPILLSVVVYLFRHEASSLEILTAASVYGFVISLFSSSVDGFFAFVAALGAAGSSVLALEILHGSRLRTRLKGFDAALVATFFTSTYWLIQSVQHLGLFDPIRLVFFIIGSTAINLLLMMASDIGYRKLAVR